MNILLLGSGGRESALAWKMAQSKHHTKLYIAPGNGGTLQYGINVEIAATDIEQIAKFALENDIHLIVCGPEQPAVAGLYDFFQSKNLKHIPVIAPAQTSAMLEGSKAYAKRFMARHQIPTADYTEVTLQNIDEAMAQIDRGQPPYVIKADGLAEGKGVVLPETKEEAKKLLYEFIVDKKFGKSSEVVVLEEFLTGTEFSIFVYTNGYQYAVLPNAKDYKRRYEQDKGLNTGGMGCISPVPFVDQELMEWVEQHVIKPTIKGLQVDNMPYHGFIYFGLISQEIGAKVIEYNCRLGDPETEVILPRIGADLIDLFQAGLEGRLDQFDPQISEHAAATVMLVSDGYPEAYQKGYLITGIENVNDSIVFHAGTTLKDHQLVTNGGRVIAVTSLGDTLQEALDTSYHSIDRIRYQGRQYRVDIGFEFI